MIYLVKLVGEDEKDDIVFNCAEEQVNSFVKSIVNNELITINNDLQVWFNLTKFKRIVVQKTQEIQPNGEQVGQEQSTSSN